MDAPAARSRESRLATRVIGTPATLGQKWDHDRPLAATCEDFDARTSGRAHVSINSTSTRREPVRSRPTEAGCSTRVEREPASNGATTIRVVVRGRWPRPPDRRRLIAEEGMPSSGAMGRLCIPVTPVQLVAGASSVAIAIRRNGLPAGTIRAVIERVGVVGSGIMGVGHRRGRRRLGLRRGRAKPLPGDRRRHARRPRDDARPTGRAREAHRGGGRRDPLARVRATGELEDLAECDLVIESVVEDLAVKKALFLELDRLTKRDAILATNTSTLPVVELAMETSRPELVCGLHFFNPAAAMRLVEVVVPITAAPDTIKAVARVRRGVRQGGGRGPGPGRLRRERAPLPVPQQRHAPPRGRRWRRWRASTRR